MREALAASLPVIDAAAPAAPIKRASGEGLAPYLLVAPLALVFLLFFVVPMLLVMAVSFFDYEAYDMLIPAFSLQNYVDVFSEQVTWDTYLSTLKFCLLVWAITLVLGFAIAYYLAFYVSSLSWQMTLFLICTIPFWTSNVIRMISWIPLLGRNGVVNSTLLSLGIVDQPQEWLLYSDFSVTLGFVHLYTLFMIVPIFNSMVRIDKSLIEAATDAGASEWQTIRHVILPLVKPGIVIGSIFVITIVMGDFVTVNVLGGGKVASIGKSIATELSYLQFPPAAANAMVLLLTVILMIVALGKVVDVRREL
jgi:putative spermidine/putrescine transport system permease protein